MDGWNCSGCYKKVSALIHDSQVCVQDVRSVSWIRVFKTLGGSRRCGGCEIIEWVAVAFLVSDLLVSCRGRGFENGKPYCVQDLVWAKRISCLFKKSPYLSKQEDIDSYSSHAHSVTSVLCLPKS